MYMFINKKLQINQLEPLKNPWFVIFCSTIQLGVKSPTIKGRMCQKNGIFSWAVVALGKQNNLSTWGGAQDLWQITKANLTNTLPSYA
jgi:hypothetical protein